MPIQPSSVLAGGSREPSRHPVSLAGGSEEPVQHPALSAGGSGQPSQPHVSSAGGPKEPVQPHALSAGGPQEPVKYHATKAWGSEEPSQHHASLTGVLEDPASTSSCLLTALGCSATICSNTSNFHAYGPASSGPAVLHRHPIQLGLYHLTFAGHLLCRDYYPCGEEVNLFTQTTPGGNI